MTSALHGGKELMTTGAEQHLDVTHAGHALEFGHEIVHVLLLASFPLTLFL